MSPPKNGKPKAGRAENRPAANENSMLFDMPSCGGCSTCELACSFHHTGEFDPKASSLKIVEKEDGPGYYVMLVDNKTGESMACDACKDRDIPLCVEHCRESDDLTKILFEFEQKRKKNKP